MNVNSESFSDYVFNVLGETNIQDNADSSPEKHDEVSMNTKIVHN